jgi:hypothetical protein
MLANEGRDMDMIKLVKEFPNGASALAVRVRPDADPAQVAEVLELPGSRPLLLLSGGAGAMSGALRGRLSPFFSALASALVLANISVIDGGTRSGVMALMGQALAAAGRSAPYIGVLPARVTTGPGGAEGEDLLEPHHSHFVLIQSGQWGAESRFMAALATHLAGSARSLVLLVNGGQVAIQDVESNLRQGRQVVVLAGSARLADQIAAEARRQAREARRRRSSLSTGVRLVERAFFPKTHARRERIAAIARQGRVVVVDLSQPPAQLAAWLIQQLKG